MTNERAFLLVEFLACLLFLGCFTVRTLYDRRDV